MLRSVSDNNIMTDSSLTFIKKSLHVEKYIGESGQLLLILQQLCQVVSDGLCVVVVDDAHPHSTQGTEFSRELLRAL